MNDETNHTPPDIRSAAEVLDRLAQRDAASAPPGLEDRIFLRTAASLRDPAAQSDAPAPAPIPMWHRPAFRLAAAIALVATVSLFFLIPNQPPALADEDTNTEQILEELDSILAVAYQTESIPELDTLDAEISELFHNDALADLDAWLETEEAL